jgi:spore germination protein GerM
MMRRSLLATVSIAATLVACGTANDHYRPIDNADVRAAFQETNTTTTAITIFASTSTAPTVPKTTTTTTVPTESVIVYFVTDEGKLRGAKRVHPVGYNRDVVIADLRAAPVAADGPGLRTVVDGAVIKSVDFTAVPPVVDLSSIVKLNTVTDAHRAAIAGQIAATLTKLPNIWQVSFTVDGEPWPTPLPDGQVVTRPVSGADFASLFVP